MNKQLNIGVQRMKIRSQKCRNLHELFGDIVVKEVSLEQQGGYSKLEEYALSNAIEHLMLARISTSPNSFETSTIFGKLTSMV